jgi:hypothetical protein
MMSAEGVIGALVEEWYSGRAVVVRALAARLEKSSSL